MGWPARIGWGLLAALAVALGVAWFLHTHERVEDTVPLPPRGEAAYNPLYALRESLRAAGVPAESRRRLDGERALGVRDTVLMIGDPGTASPGDVQRLLDWVETGGHLLVRTPPWTRRPREAQAWGLLERLGVQPVGAPGQCASLHIEGQSPHVEFCRGQRFVLVDRTPELRWQAEAPSARADGAADAGAVDPQMQAVLERLAQQRRATEQSLVYARLAHGAGRVDVLADFDFLENASLRDVPHQRLARQILAPNWGHGTMHLVYAARVPPLWWLLLTRGWMAWGPLLLALAAWLWMRTQRFGPLLPTPPLARRALLEHVGASGEHLVRYGRAALLHEAVRAAFYDRLRRRDPLAAALEGEAGIEAIAARTGLPPRDVRQALQPPKPDDAAAFRQRVARLIQMRRRL